MLTCKETQWTHLVLDIHYTHACVGRPIKPFFALTAYITFFPCKWTIFLLLTQSLSKFDWFVETEKCVHFLAPCSSRIICQVLTHDWLDRQTTNTKEGNKAGTKVGPDQLGPPVWVGSTRIDSDQLGSNKKIKVK